MEKRGKIMADEKYSAFKVPLVSADELAVVKERGEDISYEEEDRYVEAYQLNGHLYIAGIRDLGPGEGGS